MTDSRLTHDILSEDVRENVSGKGREGNKEGKGTRVETSHHDVTYVPAARASSAASTRLITTDGMVTDLSTIEGVDLDADVPCGHSQHQERHHPDEPAKFIVNCLSPCGCEPAVTYPLCEAGWAWLGRGFVACFVCYGTWRRDELMRIVEVLR